MTDQSTADRNATPSDGWPTEAQLNQARRNLTTFVTVQAEAAASRLGFGWRPTELAPSTYPELCREHRACEISALPLRVSSRSCDRSIHLTAADSHAMRFWRATSHVRLRLGFSAEDEMELGCHYLEALRAGGFTPCSVEHQLLHADTLGQTLCLVMLGHFPADQLRFATTAIKLGLEAAIAEEASVVTAGTNVEDDAKVRTIRRVRRRGRSWNSRHDLGGDAA